MYANLLLHTSDLDDLTSIQTDYKVHPGNAKPQLPAQKRAKSIHPALGLCDYECEAKSS